METKANAKRRDGESWKEQEGMALYRPFQLASFSWFDNNLRLANHRLRLFVVKTGLNLIFIQYTILVGIHFFP